MWIFLFHEQGSIQVHTIMKEGSWMGIERTDLWLDEYFHQPTQLIKEHIVSPVKEDAHKLYNYLRSFGMYSPNERTKEILAQLIEHDYWSKSNKILNQYRNRWNGPNVPVYIFPIHTNVKQKMCGVSFKNKMFLFLSPLKDIKELEALIVHEYHHVCRLRSHQKTPRDYSVLDSMVMEGFAELAVKNYCGENYNAKWIHQYHESELEKFWEKYVKNHIHATRTDKIHDALLFGKGFFPHLLGYSIGYWLISKANEKQKFSIEESFNVTSDEVLIRSGKMNSSSLEKDNNNEK
jgi:uncharacterized protein YjaZ